MGRDGYPAALSFFIDVEVIGFSGGLFALVYAGEYGAGVYEADGTVESDLNSIYFAGKKMRRSDKTIQDLLPVASLAGRVDQDEIIGEDRT